MKLKTECLSLFITQRNKGLQLFIRIQQQSRRSGIDTFLTIDFVGKNIRTSKRVQKWSTYDIQEHFINTFYIGGEQNSGGQCCLEKGCQLCSLIVQHLVNGGQDLWQSSGYLHKTNDCSLLRLSIPFQLDTMIADSRQSYQTEF